MSDLLTQQGELESRLGIPPLEVLLAERDKLVEQVAPLRARHGNFGSYADLRKIELATIAQTIRASAVRDGLKMTETAIDDAAHADPRYIKFVTDSTLQKAELAILENTIQGISEQVYRGNALIRFQTSEAQL